VKAANAKRVLWFLHDQYSLARLGGVADVVLAADTAACLVSFLRELDLCPLLLSVHKAELAYAHGRNFLRHLIRLAKSVEDRRLLRVTPKVHSFDHLLRVMRRHRLNPAKLANFIDEDLQGKLSRIGKRCHRTTVASSILLRCLASAECNLWQSLLLCASSQLKLAGKTLSESAACVVCLGLGRYKLFVSLRWRRLAGRTFADRESRHGFCVKCFLQDVAASFQMS
jgi:hypothetical protein